MFTLVLNLFMNLFLGGPFFSSVSFSLSLFLSQEDWNAVLQSLVTNLKSGLRFGAISFRDSILQQHVRRDVLIGALKFWYCFRPPKILLQLFVFLFSNLKMNKKERI